MIRQIIEGTAAYVKQLLGGKFMKKSEAAWMRLSGSALLIALLLIIGLWNRVQDFLDAGFMDVQITMADGRIPCAVAVMRKKV